MKREEGGDAGPPIYVVSGGVGQCGKQVVETVLAQFPESHLPVITRAYVRNAKQVQTVVRQAQLNGGTIVHTLVDGRLRSSLQEIARGAEVEAIDLFGDLMGRIELLTGRPPEGRPGLYHQLRQDYYERVAAIEFAISKDDGLSPRDWPRADMVLVGPSRVGKTPLSMYLAVMGWKVANLPLVLDIQPPDELFEIDSRRVFGLVMSPDRAMEHRRERQQRLPSGCESYSDPNRVAAEMSHTRRICRRGRFTVRDVTGAPIETTSRQLIKLLDQRFGDEARLRAGPSRGRP